MNKLSLINLELIFSNLTDADSINLKKINKYCNKLEIKRLENINVCKKLTNEILNRYPNLVTLNLSGNYNVTKINHLTRLKKLNACATANSKINNDSIRGLKLQTLIAWNNSEITDVKEMTSLRELDASWNCGIGDAGIKGLRLVKLNASDNRKITNISEIKSLKILDACGNKCQIDNIGIKGLRLIKLNASGNTHITDVTEMTSLRELSATWDSALDDKGIKGLKLIKLNAAGNSYITDVTEMISLRELNARFNSALDDKGIKGLKLIKLNAAKNRKITRDANPKVKIFIDNYECL